MNYILLITASILLGILIFKWKKFSKWLEGLLTTKIGQSFQNKIFLPARFWIKWNLGNLKNKDIDKKENRKITFEDDFEKEQLDREKWNTAFPWGRAENNSWVTDGDNLKIKKGKLQFLTKKEKTVHDTWKGKVKKDFTTPHLDTKGKHHQIFGRFDIKVKLSTKRGLWPAFWLLTETYKHPDIPQLNEDQYEKGIEPASIIPEVDIFEQFGRKKGNEMQFTLHGGYLYSSPWGTSYASKIKGVDFSNKFIKVSVDITKDFIKWYVNDCLTKVIYQKNLEQSERVFRPVYLIVSTGDRESLYQACEKNENHLPDGMVVDWVRAYEPLYYK